MATPTSVPYPREFQAATGNQLSTLDHGILAKKYGSQLVLAGRFPKGIIYKIAPIEIVNLGVCNRCLILVESTQLFKFGAFSDEEDAKIFVDKDMVLVCAPPLDENASFVLADLAWRESSLLETTIIALESLSITASWTSNRAKRATGELFAATCKSPPNGGPRPIGCCLATPRADGRPISRANGRSMPRAAVWMSLISSWRA